MADNAGGESPSLSPIPSIARSSDAENGASVDQAGDDHSQESPSPKDGTTLRALVYANRLLSNADARKRNFLVGKSAQSSESTNNDIQTYFPDQRSLTIMIATWNTGEASKLYEQNYTPTARDRAQPKERLLDDLSDILLPIFVDFVSDIIIICTQEMSVAKKSMDWEVLLQEVIGPTHVLFHALHFGTLSLCVFLRRDLIWFCTEPEEHVVKFRAINPLRTKASLIITFNLFGTSFMLINSHFEAGHNSDGCANRRLNFQNTTRTLSRAPASSSPETPNSEPSSSSTSLKAPYDHKSYDCVLWGGDMNFRLETSREDILEHCKKGTFEEILLKDEFRTAQKTDADLFGKFKEAAIHFPPTYKFSLRNNEDTYVTHRTPAYTDRILYCDKPSSPIECTQYKSVQSVKHSDHKPVVAHFCVKLKPGLHAENLSYGKFNHEVYKRGMSFSFDGAPLHSEYGLGCEQREQHHSFGIDSRRNTKRLAGMPGSAVCTLQ